MASQVLANLRQVTAALAAREGYAVVIDSSTGALAIDTNAVRAEDLTNRIVSIYNQRFPDAVIVK